MTRRKDGRWQAVITIDGKRRYFLGKTQKEVYAKIAAAKEKKEKTRLFASVAEDWRAEHYEEIAPSTAKGYEPSYKRAVAEFGETPIDEIYTDEIEALFKYLASRKYSKRVVAAQKNVLNMIFNYAISRRLIQHNPCDCAKMPKHLPSQPRELPTEADIAAVENSEWLFPFFLAYTGMRRGEALAIRYEDIDREKKIITVNKSVGFDHNQPYIKKPKTASGIRTIVLLDKLLDRLPNKRSGLIFSPTGDTLYKDSQIQTAWAKWQRENHTTVTAHQLRHYYATLLFEAEISAKDAQAMLGHSSVKVTQDIYTHIREQRRSAAAEKLNLYVNSMANSL